MRINQNIAAMNTYSKLTSANTSKSKSLEKLSSGLRINRAGDDAAGLAISEKMRGQISGLNQGVSNAQDAISLIQTAEGALSETHSILQRMRELGVQSSNDTNTVEDRKEIQKEMDQLNSEITRISSDTEFNTKKLLDGTVKNSATTIDATNLAKLTSTTISDDNMKAGVYTVDVKSATVAGTASDATTTGVDTATAAVLTDVALGDYTVELTANGAAWDLTLKDSDGNKIAEELNKTIAVGGSQAVGGIELKFGTAAAGTVKVNVSANLSVEVKDSKDVIIGSKTIAGDKTGTVEVGGLKLDFDSNLTAAVSTVTVETDALSFQIGANEGQNTKLAIADMSATGLDVADIDLTTKEGASSAITVIDKAIASVSSERSKLGATQNRLDHTINNLTTTSENLVAAESRIRDVDMAKEMMEFTKNNILSQAATSMLAQANQMPQSVLQLLQ